MQAPEHSPAGFALVILNKDYGFAVTRDRYQRVEIPLGESLDKIAPLIPVHFRLEKEQVVDFRFQNLHNPKVAILSQKTDPGMESV